MTKKFEENIIMYKAKRQIICQTVLVLFRLKMRWRIKIKKYGPDPYVRTFRLMRNYFTMTAVKDENQLKKKCIRWLRDFILTKVGNDIMVLHFREFYVANTHMQTWIRN